MHTNASRLTRLELPDWNALWTDQIRKWKECNSANCTGYWQDRESARRYLDSMDSTSQRLDDLIESINLKEGDRVLDIGAGPGVCALPMARTAGHVCAVEPSPGMTAVLEEEMEARNIDNISCVRKRWEDVDPAEDLDGTFDIIMASMSLGMPDIRDAVRKMISVSSGSVHMIWAAEKPSWEILPDAVWPLLHNREYAPPPRAGVLFNVLCDMGVYPDVSTRLFHHDEWYTDTEDACEFFAARYGATTPEHRDIIRSRLDDMLIPDGERCRLRYDIRCMHIHWNTRDYPDVARQCALHTDPEASS